MKKSIIAFATLALLAAGTLEATAGCGGRLLGGRSCGSSRGPIFNGRLRDGSCGISRASSCGSSCGQAVRATGCVECQKDAASATPKKVEQK